MTIEFLDRSLMYLKNKSSFVPTMIEIPEFTQSENKLLVRAFYKMEKDGYVYSITRQGTNGKNIITFYISFDGLLAQDAAPLIWKNKPYKWSALKMQLKIVWNVAKLLAIIINAIIVLVFTYLTYIKPH